MRVAGVGASVELRVVGYETDLDESAGHDPEPDWLIVRGVVYDGTGVREFQTLSLDTEEAQELALWMRAVAAGDNTPAPADQPSNALLYFTEPDIAVRLLSRDQSAVTTRWYFSDPEGPEAAADELMSQRARVVDVAASRTQFESEADTWLKELARFPNRLRMLRR